MQMPIVSPWLIYIINTIPSIKVVCVIAAIVSFICALYCFYMHNNYSDLADPREYYTYQNNIGNKARKAIKPFLIIGVVLLICGVSLPDRGTCYQMLVSHYVTYENAELAGDQAKEMVDYVLDRVDEITNGE